MMFDNVMNKRRIAIAGTALTVAGLGIGSLFGGGTSAVSAAGKVRAASPAASVDGNAVVGGATEYAAALADRAAERAAFRGVRLAAGLVGRTSDSVIAPADAHRGAQAAAAPAADAIDGDTADIVVRVPQRVSVTLPRVSNVRLPRVEGPRVALGTLPSAQIGWTSTVDLGDPEPQVTAPKVHVDQVATVTMPGASID